MGSALMASWTSYLSVPTTIPVALKCFLPKKTKMANLMNQAPGPLLHSHPWRLSATSTVDPFIYTIYQLSVKELLMPPWDRNCLCVCACGYVYVCMCGSLCVCVCLCCVYTSLVVLVCLYVAVLLYLLCACVSI